MMIFVLSKLAAREPASSEYSNLSPPTVIRARYYSSLSGLKSHTKLLYVTFLLDGTSFLDTNSVVSVP